MEIKFDPRGKTYLYEHCVSCSASFTYKFEETFVGFSPTVDLRYVTCPICGQELRHAHAKVIPDKEEREEPTLQNERVWLYPPRVKQTFWSQTWWMGIIAIIMFIICTIKTLNLY